MEGYVDGLTAANEDDQEVYSKFLEKTVFNLMNIDCCSTPFQNREPLYADVFDGALLQPSCS